MPAIHDRASILGRLRHILTGWHQILRRTSASGCVWETAGGIRTENFLSSSGRQCDGVTRMLPVFAAWVSQAENPETITLEDGVVIRPLELLRNGLVHGTDPKHADFWQYAPSTTNNQRQVESSIVAWSLWLARDQLLPTLSRREIENIQRWLESCTVCMDLWGNWSMFFATNHAARIALEKWGFHGDIEIVRKYLICGDETDAGDGWMFDVRWSGLDYYNFWVNGSHHFYIRCMLPEYQNPVLDRAIERAGWRFGDLPYLMDGEGNQVLFGRSLAYRFGWMNGLMAAVFCGNSSIAPGLARVMLGRNLASWFGIGAFHEDGSFLERLSPRGSDGGRDRYINCGHPYWGMQAFLCMALPSSDAFWSEPAGTLPSEAGDFLVARQGPGFVFQGRRGADVRVFNFRNLNHHGHPLYEKFVYSSAFPCNAAVAKHPSGDIEKDRRTCWDNQFAMRLADGSHVGPAEVPFVDVGDGRRVEVVMRFKPTAQCAALVRTVVEIEAAGYRTSHHVHVTGRAPEGSVWVEGGFVLERKNAGENGEKAEEKGQKAGDLGENRRKVAKNGEKSVWSENVEGWEVLHDADRWREVCTEAGAGGGNIVHGDGVHFLLTAAVREGAMVLKARHGAS